MSNPSVRHDPENVRTDDHPAAPRASETGGPMAQGTRLYDRHQEDSERASERTEAVPRRYRHLFCPHCHLWIGDPDDPDIASRSIAHDFTACEEETR
jgi:hypothetical protein